MIELTYRLDPQHLVIYRKLAWYHAMRSGEDAGAAWGRYFLLSFIVAAVLAAADVSFPAITGRPFTYPEFLSGFAVGYLVLFASMSWQYRRYTRAVTKVDGPTTSEHRIRVTEEGLGSKTAFAEGIYRWPAFTEVTVSAGVIVLWMEPGAGLLVPRSAFADPAAETAFLGAVAKFMAAAGGRRGAAPASVAP